MSYKGMISYAMDSLASVDSSIFIGYNLANASCSYGTLKNIPRNKIIEMPVAEQLMTGMAIGMSLDGMLPVLIFERQDFMLLALDQLVNHLSKICDMSEGEFNPRIIIRAIVGKTNPFDPGIQHRQNYTDVLKKLCNFPVVECKTEADIYGAYFKAIFSPSSTMVVEYADLYQEDKA